METQAWYLSKGMWGSLLGVVSLVLTAFGIDALDAATQAAILSNLMIVIPGVVALISSVVSMVGRIQAKKLIALTAASAAKANATLTPTP